MNASPTGSGRPRVVVVDHQDSYTFNLVHLVAAVTGALPDVVDHHEATVAELGGYSHVVLSPGPGHPSVVRDFDVGRQLLASGAVPVLGVCLGMQGLVAGYGGRVEAVLPAHGDVAAVRHHGRGLFDGIPSPFDAVRYHSLAAVAVPEALEVTAYAEDGTVMGVAHRTRPLAGVQFHPESILTTHGARIVENFLSGRLR